jgi:adenylate cyclase
VEILFGEHQLDVDRRELRSGAELIAVEPQVFDLLVYLVRNRDRVVSKDDLMAGVWGGRIVSESTLTSHIHAARKAVGDSGEAQRLIRTLPRKGFRFVGDVQEVQQRAMPLGDLPSAPTASISQSPAAPRLSIVVLPFTNLSDDREQQYFADGITDDLTTDLSRMSGSFVIARSTAFTYRGISIDAKLLGRELGVRYVLEGSVRSVGDQLRVNVQLLDAESGAHLWAERFDTNRTSVTDAQNEISGRLTRTLRRELVETVRRRIEQEGGADSDSRGLVMQGWAWHYRPFSAMTREEALRAHEQALQIDPDSVDARIGIAAILAGNLAGGWSGSFEGDLARSEQLLLEALERDANRAWMHATMGLVRRLQNRLIESQIECETAIGLDRNYASAYRQLGITLMCLCQPEKAIPHLEKAIHLNPHDRNTPVSSWALGQCHFFLWRIEQAIDLFRKARAGNPWLYYTHLALAAGLGLKGEFREAATALAEGIKLKPEVSSLSRLRSYPPYAMNLPSGLRQETVEVGLLRAGMPEE